MKDTSTDQHRPPVALKMSLTDILDELKEDVVETPPKLSVTLPPTNSKLKKTSSKKKKKSLSAEKVPKSWLEKKD